MKYLFFMSCLGAVVLSVLLIDSRAPDYAPVAQLTSSPALIHATGIVEGATRDVQLRPEIVGRVVEVCVAIGETVQRGDILLRLDDERQRQLVEVNRASLELAQAKLERLVNGARQSERDEAKALVAAKQAQLDQAVGVWNRVRELHHQSAVSKQEADDSEAKVKALAAEVEAAKARWEQVEAPARSDEVREAQAGVAYAEAQLNLAQVELDKCQLRAPSAGCILDIQVEPGEVVRPDGLAPAVVLSDASQTRVRAFVEEIDSPRLRTGVSVDVTADGLPGVVFGGIVDSLSPRMAPKQTNSGAADELYDTKVREVLITLNTPSDLMIGLRVDVEFNAEAKVDVADGATAPKLATDGPVAETSWQ